MGLPFFKLFSLLVRITSRPLSKFLILVMKKRRLAHQCFQSLGNRAQEFEAYLDYRAAHPNVKVKRELIKVEPLSDEEAFEKGIDYFVEIVIFYGLLGALSIYELRKGIEGAHH